jgi:uncharacterized protein YecE (DUF72 family)
LKPALVIGRTLSMLTISKAQNASVPLFVGTAGWAIPAAVRNTFPLEGTALQRYAGVMPCAEVNSSFHRPHRRATWERWADSVPEGFRFSVKIPKAISHTRRLVDAEAELAQFIAEAAGLGGRLAIFLLQLPPSLVFDPETTAAFLSATRSLTDVPVVIEPRHASWFEPIADALLAELRVARIAADPVKVPAAARPGGWRGLSYFRLHGSPVMYRSAYDEDRLQDYAAALTQDVAAGRPVWCIFDNTASSAALADALTLTRFLQAASS